MARAVEYRIALQGTLQAVTPLHIGSGSEGVLSDAMLARDGQGKLVMPGTSLAGPIRDYLERYFKSTDDQSNGDDPRDLLGFQRDDKGLASRLMIDDAPLDGEQITEVRDSVAIGRATGVAVDQLKFDREILPVGVTFPLQLRWDCRDEAQMKRFNAALASLVAALIDERVRFGACVNRGLGRVRLLGGHKTRCFALRTSEGITDWLGHLIDAGSDSETTIELPESTICEPAGIDIEIAFQPVGPLMVKAAIDGDGADMLPLVTHRATEQADAPRQVLPVIPGTSIRGAMRSDAERILRTLLGASPDHGDQQSYNEQDLFQQSLERLPLTCWLFGRAGQRTAQKTENRLAVGDEPSDGHPRQGRGGLAIDDCLAEPEEFPRLTASQWAEIARAEVDVAPGEESSPLRQKLDQFGLGNWTTGFRVSIDRWTGGAAEGMFFKILEPRAVTWQPIRMRLDLQRLPSDLQGPAIALLLLTLDRLAQGHIPLGHDVNRGMGHVGATCINLRGRSLPPWLASLERFELGPTSDEPSLLAMLDSQLRQELTAGWRSHLEDELNQVEPRN